MIAPIIPIAAARAKRLAGSANSGTMFARLQGGRIELRFNQPVDAFHLSPAQARFWANALTTLADSADPVGA